MSKIISYLIVVFVMFAICLFVPPQFSKEHSLIIALVCGNTALVIWKKDI
jgi:cell division protein FtsW (lipid II flippase)